MTPRCGDLEWFFDGELAGRAAEAMRVHVGTCERCQRRLHGLLAERALLVEEAGARVDAIAEPAPRRAWRLAPVLLATALAIWLAWPH